MKIMRGYKTELDLNNRQRTHCLQHAGAARFSYNWGLVRRKAVYEATGQRLTAIDLHKELNRLKKTDYPWMYEVSKCAPQEALRDLDRAYANFFRRVKLKQAGKLSGKVGYPRFKSKKRGVGSFRLTGVIRVFDGHVQLPRLGRLKLKECGYLPTGDVHILSATVSEKAGRWFVSVQVEEEIPDPEPAQGAPVGVDLGITTLATCSNGAVYENPKALHQAQKKLRRLQRRFSRQQKGSRNREKTRRKIACLHFRIANIRRDALHKATSGIVAKTKPPALRPYAVVLEDLNVNGMLKNRCLARAISDVGMHEFRRQISYKTQWSGSEIALADPWYPSSKMCSRCGQVKQALQLSERTYRCEDCGLVIDRDLNAAQHLAQLLPESNQRNAPTASSVERAAQDAANACGEDLRPEDVGQPSWKQEPNCSLGSA